MSKQKLFDLLPAVYRLKDVQLTQSQNLLTASEVAQLQALRSMASPLPAAQQAQLNQLTAKAARGPLQSLLMVIDEQLATVEYDLDQLYDDQFIETCAQWVIPYIGDLIGYQVVNGVAPAVASPRSEVANTISFRRRKGSIMVLEQLARDVTGWGAHATEFFKVLAATQYVKQIRPHNDYAPDVRYWQTREYVDTAFDAAAHTVDVRRIATGRGRYNIHNIGIFLWSLNAYRLTNVPATSVDSSGRFFRFSALGADMALFNNPVSQGTDITAASQPVNLPDRLRRRVLCQDIQSGVATVYYGQGNSLALYLNNALLNPYQIQVCNLSGPDGNWANVPPIGSSNFACIDPELGRIALAAPLQPPPPAGSATPQLQASFYYGFNGDMGGGEYSRSDSFTVQTEAAVLPFPDISSPPRYSSLQAALNFAASAAINLEGQGQVAVEITDSGIYSELGSPALQVNVPAGATIELRAADGHRPALLLGGEISVTGGAESAFYLNGFVIAYASNAQGPGVPPALLHAPNSGANQLATLQLTHCTLVPGWALSPTGGPQPHFAGYPALLVESSGLQVEVQRSIVGGLRISTAATANLSDSILDAGDPTGIAYAGLDGSSAGGSLTLQACTIIGKIHASLFALISDSILWAGLASGDNWSAPVLADRKQAGCVRFSYLPPGSVVPRQFKCAGASSGGLPPSFYSLRYGDPGYGKLLPSTDKSIRQGADDGGEMGAFHFVLAPQRENDLKVRLQEYLPVSLEFGIFYQT
jgi:hypothetical protein